MDFKLWEQEAPKVQVIPVCLWGLLIMPQLDAYWPIGDMDDQFLDSEPEVINLDSNDKAIKGLKDIIIVSDDSD